VIERERMIERGLKTRKKKKDRRTYRMEKREKQSEGERIKQYKSKV
jgi:hypothetical protein